MQVLLADKAGFCSGVSRAINHLLEEAARCGGGSTFGPLVHNKEVVDYLRQRNIVSIDSKDQAVGAFIAVRTHGVTPGMLEKLHAIKDKKIIDLTCPRVQSVQKKAACLRESGINIFIFGNAEHPEVQGLIGWAGGRATVVSSLQELEQIDIPPLSGLIAQTTSDPDLYERVKLLFMARNPRGTVYNTLCPETKLRQEEIGRLARRVDALLVVGSDFSANTKSLYDCCRQLKPSCRITNAGELDRSFVEKHRVIGVTAGASTPPWTIKEVVEKMENENGSVEKMENENGSLEEMENENGSVEERNEEQFDFDVDVKVAQVGEQVRGKVARVTGEEVYVDIGAKTEAILPVTEVHLDEEKGLEDLFSPEDEIEVTVLETDEQEGKVVVSHKRLARDKRLQELEQTHVDDEVMEGQVKQVVSAGLVIDLGSGVEGFMPGSLVDTRYIPDFKEFKDQDLQFKVLEFDRNKGKIILSRKKILEEEAEHKKEETLNSIEVGSTITGTVKRLTNFGAFVDVGNIDGLVHISELAWERVGHPSEVLKNGDEVNVKVLEVIPERERISLSIRKTLPDPWTRAVAELESDQLIKGKVTRLVNFGAFIEIKPGVEGLAHISQLADFHVKHPSEVLTEGEEVEVKILEVKSKAKRISLSVKDARGKMPAAKKEDKADEEDGSVTLGDVFGNLFNDREMQESGQEKTGSKIDPEAKSEVEEEAKVEVEEEAKAEAEVEVEVEVEEEAKAEAEVEEVKAKTEVAEEAKAEVEEEAKAEAEEEAKAEAEVEEVKAKTEVEEEAKAEVEEEAELEEKVEAFEEKVETVEVEDKEEIKELKSGSVDLLEAGEEKVEEEAVNVLPEEEAAGQEAVVEFQGETASGAIEEEVKEEESAKENKEE